jgi:hypothetical protein
MRWSIHLAPAYAHLPWNGPFYAREGFQAVPDHECGPQILHHLHAQRQVLPAPDQRIAMRRALGQGR